MAPSGTRRSELKIFNSTPFYMLGEGISVPGAGCTAAELSFVLHLQERLL